MLTECQVKLEWAQCCQQAFEELKRKLISSPILSFPMKQKEFILDASNHGIGAVLFTSAGSY